MHFEIQSMHLRILMERIIIMKKIQNSTNSSQAFEQHKCKLITRCTMKEQRSNKLGGVQATTQFKASSKSR